MKKLSLIVLIAVFVLCFSVVAFAEVTITIGDVTVVKGAETVDVPITLSGNTDGILGFELDLAYDTDLSIKEINRGDALSILDYTPTKDFTQNPMPLCLDGFDVADTSNGNLWTITFNIPTELGDYSLLDDFVQIYDYDTSPVDYTVIPGKISVVGPAVEPTGDALTNPGVSLLLDGSIGVKFNVEYDAELVDSINLNANIANSDDSSSIDKVIPFGLKDGVASAVVYVPAKDIDNISITATATANLIEGGSATEELGTVTVPMYVDELEKLAQNDTTYARALDVVHAMETYCVYADNYFGEGTLESIVLTDAEESAIKALTAPQKTPEEITSLKFWGTSLLLEGRVTLRHYFKVNGQDFNPESYTVTGGTALKYEDSTTVYTDIENISANELNKRKIVTITKGDEQLEIRFAALNYVALSLENENVKLRDLVKTLYRYSVEANKYAKEIQSGNNEIGNQEW